MLERDLIQTRGFHNIRENGEITGFQFEVRLTYYRGIFLSQLRPGPVTADGETFPKEQVIWSLGGRDYSYQEIIYNSETHWGPLEPAVLKIRKPGGLAPGYHEITAGYKYSSSYMPPKLQEAIEDEAPNPFLEMMFGQLHSTRKLLLVR